MLKLLRSPSALLPEQIFQLKKEVVGSVNVEAEALYAEVSDVMFQFAMCTQNATKFQLFPCRRCTKKLKEQAAIFNEQNTVLVALLNEIIRVVKRGPVFCRALCRIFNDLVDIKKEALVKFKNKAAVGDDISVWEYWSKYGHFEQSTDESLDDGHVDSMYFFLVETYSDCQ